MVSSDLHLTHGYLNALQAGFQGAFVSRSVLDQLGFPAPESMGNVDDFKRGLDRLAPMREQLMNGTPLLAVGRAPEPRGEGDIILKYFDVLKMEIVDAASRVAHALQYVRNDEPQAANYTMAAILRHAYARDHYIRGNVAFAERFALEDDADRWRQQTLQTQQEVGVAHTLLEKVRARAFDDLLRFELWNEAAGLPGIFRSQLADFTSLETFGGAPESFEAYLGDADVDGWRSSGLPPYASGLWASYWFKPEDVPLWRGAGIAEPSEAGAWRLRGFSVAQAKLWHDDGYDAITAATAVASGCATPQALRQAIDS